MDLPKIVICVDVSSSMGCRVPGNRTTEDRTIMDLVNERIGTFCKTLQENGNDCVVQMFPKYGPEALPGAYMAMVPGENRMQNGVFLADVLANAIRHLESGREKFLVLVTDGVLEPQEDETKLREVIARIRDPRRQITSFTVGFHTENREPTIESLLDAFTGRRMITWTDSNAYQKRFEEIGLKIQEMMRRTMEAVPQQVYVPQPEELVQKTVQQPDQPNQQDMTHII